MFEQIQLGEKPNLDSHAYSQYATDREQDELIAEAWDGRNLSDRSTEYDSHLTRNEYHVVYKTQTGEYIIYSFTNIGYVPAIPVSPEKLERAHSGEPACVHMQHCGWSDGSQPLDKAIEWWNQTTHNLSSRTAPQPG